VSDALATTVPGSAAMPAEANVQAPPPVDSASTTQAPAEAQASPARPPVLLLMDNFRAHCEEGVVAHGERLGARTMMLPPNMTSQLQPLDVGINKTFKANIRRLFMDYLVHEFAGDAQRMRSPTRQQVALWVKNAWDAISPEAVKRAWHRSLFTFIDDDDDAAPFAIDEQTGAAVLPDGDDDDAQEPPDDLGIFGDVEPDDGDIEDFVRPANAPGPSQAPFSEREPASDL